MAVVFKGTTFPASVSEKVFNLVKGHSTLAKLSAREPISFAGNETFTFSMDGDIAIVAEGANKPDGGFTVSPVTIQPIKVVYQGRVSDEFLLAADEVRLQIMNAWIEGCAKKFAIGLDKMGMHGVNPATGQTSALITSYLDQVQKITATSDIEADIEGAIAAIGDAELTGYAFSKAGAAALGQIKAAGVPQYPEFRLGGKPEAFMGVPTDVNSTVAPDSVILGDFAGAFKWGYAKDIEFETIEYGDPDGLGDLKRTNEVCLRAEAYIGFAVLDPSAFARVAA